MPSMLMNKLKTRTPSELLARLKNSLGRRSTHDETQMESSAPVVINFAPDSPTELTPDSIDTLKGEKVEPPAISSAQKAESDSIWAALKVALQGLREHSSVWPPLAGLGAAIIYSIDRIPSDKRSHLDYTTFAVSFKETIDTIQQHLASPNHVQTSKAIQNIVNGIHTQLDRINTQQEKSERKQSTGPGVGQDNIDTLEPYRRIETSFRQLQANITQSEWGNLHEQAAQLSLNRLAPSEAAFDDKHSLVVHRRKCTPNTRIGVLQSLDDWSNNQSGPKVYWLNGMSGAGKTTIAYSLCDALDGTSQLAASFFCSRQLPDSRDMNKLLPTIAYQMAGFSCSFRSALCSVLTNDRALGAHDISAQFDTLIKKPLLIVKESMPDNAVVVIDALDEMSGPNDARIILDTVFRSASDLPIKFVITSRPELNILEPMLARDSQMLITCDLGDIERAIVQADIETFVADELRSMMPSEEQIRQLAERSNGSFIYAATAARFVMQ